MYLREDVYFEPLFNHWYAWPHLLSPVTASRHVANTHKRIMTSFVNNHRLHILAAKEKGLAGSEFLDCTEEQLPQVKSLLVDLEDNCRDLLELSDAVTTLDERLRKHTSGESLERLYQDVPEPLRGYVELVMDMDHRPSFRLIEPLLFRSGFYKRNLQSASFGSYSRVNARPFVLSTPRLPDENHVQIQVDFNHPLLDRMFRSREKSIGRSELKELLDEVPTAGGLHVDELFSEERSGYRHEPVTDGVRLTHTGHAGFIVETGNVSILIDPVIASRGTAFADEVVSFNQLPEKIDYVCLTHTHTDHANIETLLQLRYKIGRILVPKNNSGFVPDPSLRLILQQLNFETYEVDELDSIVIPDGKIVGIPFLGEHGDLNIRSKTAWYVELKGRKLFFGADSSNPEDRLYERLGEMITNLDVLAIGMECVGAPYTWIYGALHTKTVSKSIKESRRLNGSDCAQALRIVKVLRPKQVLIYALGLEPWYKYFMGIEYDEESRQISESKRMLNACEEIGVQAGTLFGKATMYL